MPNGLATRCPACGTVFRVVLDQLRVSEGWVRCGRCSDVFNATQTLVDLESGAPRRWQAEAQAPAPVAPPLDEPNPAADPEPPPVDDAVQFSARDDDEDDDAAPPPPPAPAQPPAPAPAPAERRAPAFVRRAERAQRWRRPRVRAGLALLALLALLGLAGQVGYVWRDLIAARVPALRQPLIDACAALGCEIGPPRAIEGVSVESSGLVRVEQSNLYRLAVALRNGAGFDVAVPALELAVTDAQGKLLARRVLRPAEMGASQIALGAGRDLQLQATLRLATEPVAGYTVEPFYP